MKVTYIDHSGFSVELKHHILLFDYFRGTLPIWSPEKEILVFASHKHYDHFDFKIFDLISQYKKIHFFLGSDIRLSGKYLERNGVDPGVKAALTNLGKNTQTQWNDVTIRTLRSTDAGVAFIVEAEGKVIYHAGDLNWWHWDGEDPDWNCQMEKDYKQEIDKLAGQHFDVAFVPLDPRLGRSYDKGLLYLLEQTDADMVFPMHMWGKYDTIARFLNSPSGKKYDGRIADIRRTGQEFLIGGGTE